MTDVRETIAGVLDDKIPEGVAILSADDVAQLFTDALPEIIARMVKPLVWEGEEASMPLCCPDCGKEGYMQKKVSHDTVTVLQAKVARLEAALECIPDKIDIYREIKRGGARKHGDIAEVISVMLDPIRAIALDTTTATCDNTREGE